MNRETLLNIKLFIIFLGLIIYLIAYWYSDYWDPKYDIFEQPYIKHVLAIPMIPLFIYFLFSGILIETDTGVEKLSWDNIFMSGFMSFMLVSVSFVAIIMVPIIFAFFAVLLGFG
tara:strand:- start:1445 stop:1789 length:345 start_codon:yes stop_codon:yes gene_type:complete